MLTEAVGPVGYAPFDQNTAATHDLVAADTRRKTRVLGLALTNMDATTAVNVTVQDNTGTPIVLIGPVRLASGQQLILPVNGLGWGEGGAAKKLQVVLSGAIRVTGCVTYQRVGPA